MVAVPNTRTRMSHAVTIRAGGRTVGAIHILSPTTARDVDHEFEVEANASGMPVDVIPQNVTRRELRVQRYDTYPEIMEDVFGTSELIVLADQRRPFRLREVWRGPGVNLLGGAGTAVGNLSSLAGGLGLSGVNAAANRAQADLENAVGAAGSSAVGMPVLSALGVLTADTRIYEYIGCWFSDLGRQLDAKGDRVVSVDATLVWTDRIRVA